jgi:hypothetical protein
VTGSRQRGPAADVTFFKTPAELRRWFAKHKRLGKLIEACVAGKRL